MKKCLWMIFIAAIILGIASYGYADRRGYVWTYEYMTMPKGMWEIEYYMTQEQPDASRFRPNTFKHWAELEYGFTDHLDVAMYQQFKQENLRNKSSFEYDGFKLRTRYRIAEKNVLPLDMLVYLEYIRDNTLSKPNVLEEKAIFAKDIGRFNIAYNQILKQELERHGKTEHEYAAGINYALRPNFKVGIESKGNYTSEKYYLGPTVAWAGRKFWAGFGILAGLNGKSDEIQSRLIVGMPF